MKNRSWLVSCNMVRNKKLELGSGQDAEYETWVGGEHVKEIKETQRG
jgi:hypothetical protein